jgi:hypothetical protein
MSTLAVVVPVSVVVCSTRRWPVRSIFTKNGSLTRPARETNEQFSHCSEFSPFSGLLFSVKTIDGVLIETRRPFWPCHESYEEEAAEKTNAHSPDDDTLTIT